MKTIRARAVILLGILLVTVTPALTAWGVQEGKAYEVPKGVGPAPISIVAGVSVGSIDFTMTKDQVLKILGNPDVIIYGDTTFSLSDSPVAAYYVFRSAGLSILFEWGIMRGISVLSEQYEFPGGIRVGMDAAQAVDVLGKPLDDAILSGGIPGHFVFVSTEAPYWFSYHPASLLVLKVDVGTNRITEMRVIPSGPSPARFGSIQEPVSEKDSKAMRDADTAILAGTGIALDQYALVPQRYDFRPANGDKPSPGPETHDYFLKTAAEKEVQAQEAAIRLARSSLLSAAPTIRDIVSKFGLPTTLLVGETIPPSGLVALSSMTYGGLTLDFDRSSKTLSGIR